MGSTDEYLARINKILDEHAPDNTAPIPLAISQERTDDGLEWAVYLHVRRPRIADFPFEVRHQDLRVALAIMHRHLSKYHAVQREAIKGDQRFGILQVA